MEVTANYYDDLAARFQLSEVLLAQLQHFHILYDEDEQAVFFQFFTKLFAGHFCFEIVQPNGYQGFGTSNAQMRVTMQTKELASLNA